MPRVSDIVAKMKRSPSSIRFSELCRVCDAYFGAARQSSGSHRIYKTPWPGDPRVNVQGRRGRAKTYQVKQVLRAIEKLEETDGPEER